jgi:hypothetical protein
MREEAACLFSENKILLVDKEENVLNEVTERIWLGLATKHFNDILINTHLGKILMGIS